MEHNALSKWRRWLGVKLVAGWRKVFYQLPFLVQLPWGSWWLTCNDVMSRHIRLHEGFEQGEQKFLLGFLQPGMVVLDIGAHHGFYTLLASPRVGNRGRVVAFEPSPREREHLQRHIWINRCTNVTVEPLALGDHRGIEELFICLGQETGCNSLRPPAISEPTHPVQTLVTTLDEYLAESHIGHVDFVKLDVEGAELEVLQGALGLLGHKPRPVILVEVDDTRTEPWGYRGAQIYEFLVNRDFRGFSVTSAGRLQPCLPKEHFHENLIAVPQEEMQLVATFTE